MGAVQGHQRRSIRLPGYDYSEPGAYFLTLVTHARRHLFGEVVEGEMRLSPAGEIAEACWRLVPGHFSHVELGAFVVMPDHLHGILVLHEMESVRARHGVPGQEGPGPVDLEAFGHPVAGSLATIVRQYKGSVTRMAGVQTGGTRLWQRNCYEDIIRNQREWERIHLYIEGNPAAWERGKGSESLAWE